MAGLDLGEFPLSASRVPDAETQARTFLTKYPESDGRGIVMAVMDTGCDPGAPGLKVTSQGLPKIIDCIDCTGSGDVDTSTVMEAVDGVVENPHSGRRLILGEGKHWKNPSGRWHVGAKKAYELFDGELVKRVTKERIANLDEKHRAYMAHAHRELSNFEWHHRAAPHGEAARKKKDLEERIAQLGSLHKAFEDQGTILDVVAWHDGRHWRAAISGKPDGDISDSPAMTSFVHERKHASLGELEQMNYCLNIYDEGHVVSIVCDVSSHGTHVAGICGACHPEDPARNGVAPGAQIVAIKIAETRLDGMETGTGLARAFAHCARAKVDLINLSFGEGSSPATTGRIIELAQRVVQQYGITFVTSAGNDGPGLSTIGAPGNGSDTFVTIGAHVSPAAMEAQYSMLEKLPSTPYTWTSRGPCQDGGLGVTVCAPGSAITSIPNWTLSGAQLMNGTSMASPNACGCLALVYSGLKNAGVPFCPPAIHRAIKASAMALPNADPFAVGAGMIQVESCYDHMVAHREDPYQDVTIQASVPGRGRGIYLREPHESTNPKTFNVRVDPIFKDFEPALNRMKIDMELNLSIVSSVPWVKTPPYVVLPAAGRVFNISVDPSGLQPDAAHLGFVSGFDATRPHLGALFRLPITVIRPVAPNICQQLQESAVVKKIGTHFTPGSLQRTFVSVPAGCTWAEFTLTTKAFDGAARLFILHVLQDIPHVAGSKSREEFVLRFPVAGVQKKTFRVESPGTLEVCLAQFWSNLGETDADLEISFHGILPDTTKLCLTADSPIASVNVVSGPGAVTIKPSASLTTHRTSLRPKVPAVIQPGGERDLYLEGKRVYELILEYTYKLEEDGEITPQALLLNDRLYESVFEGQLILIYDQNKRYIAGSDAWPTPLKLKKGEYTLRLQVRHDDAGLLEKLKSMPLSVDRKLEKAITLKSYVSFNSAVTAQGDFGELKVKGGVRAAVFFSLPVDEKLPDGVKPGDQLLGPVSYGEPAFPAAGKKSRGGWTINFAVTVPKAEDKKEDEPDDDPRTSHEKLNDAIRDAQIKHLDMLRKWAHRDEHKLLLDRLIKAHPTHLPLHLERFKGLEEIKNPDTEMAHEKETARYQSIVSAVDEMLEHVDLAALAAHLGRRIDPEDKFAVRAGKEWDKTRDAVVQGFSKKIIALAKINKAGGFFAEEGRTQVAHTFKALSAWVDTTEAKHARSVMLYEQAIGHLGLALSALNKEIAEEKAAKRELLEERAELYDHLGWHTWAREERHGLCVKFPKQYSKF